MLGTVQDSLLSLFFPQNCKTCSGQVECSADGAACLDCWNSTLLFDRSEMLCEKCGAVLGEKAAPVPVYCHQCDDHVYDRAIAIGVYEKALAATVIDMKSRPQLPTRLFQKIDLMAKVLNFSDPDIIIPVPLSVQRHSERGFNQAEIISTTVSRILGIPVDPLSLCRKMHTPMHRGGMDQRARELTVQKAFEVKRPRLIEGKKVLLVDDVFTSGSTASACARVLKRSGAINVNVFTLARAVIR